MKILLWCMIKHIKLAGQTIINREFYNYIPHNTISIVSNVAREVGFVALQIDGYRCTRGGWISVNASETENFTFGEQ